MKRTTVFLSVLAILFSFQVYADAQIEPCKNGPVHEAYITRVTGSVAVDAVPIAPPEAIREQIPPQTDASTEWIGGYWAWMAERNDYVWVSGVWRRSPPGQQWIDGYWKHFEEGWVWVRGFWSSVPAGQLVYISVAPPDAIDEDVQDAEGDDFFWSPGFWQFNSSSNDYSWVGGSWQKFDPNWVLVPSYYVWRPEGYVFISSFWDWPIEQRGDVYSCVFIPPSIRTIVEYTPVIILEPIVVVQNCFGYYPDYLWFFCHHYYYHHDYWSGCDCTPPWWGWSSWWCYPWHYQWGLCWWYGHPGYPAPMWMSAHLASQIAPPMHGFIDAFGHVSPPLIVTPHGVVPPNKLLGAIKQLNKGTAPIVPIHALPKVQGLVEPKDVTKPIRPTGPVGGTKQPLDKVWVDKGKLGDLKPNEPGKHPDIPLPKKPNVTRPNVDVKPPISVPGDKGDHVRPPFRRPPLDLNKDNNNRPHIPVKPVDPNGRPGKITPPWNQGDNVKPINPNNRPDRVTPPWNQGGGQNPENVNPNIPVKPIDPSNRPDRVTPSWNQGQQNLDNVNSRIPVKPVNPNNDQGRVTPSWNQNQGGQNFHDEVIIQNPNRGYNPDANRGNQWQTQPSDRVQRQQPNLQWNQPMHQQQHIEQQRSNRQRD